MKLFTKFVLAAALFVYPFDAHGQDDNVMYEILSGAKIVELTPVNGMIRFTIQANDGKILSGASTDESLKVMDVYGILERYHAEKELIEQKKREEREKEVLSDISYFNDDVGQEGGEYEPIDDSALLSYGLPVELDWREVEWVRMVKPELPPNAREKFLGQITDAQYKTTCSAFVQVDLNGVPIEVIISPGSCPEEFQRATKSAILRSRTKPVTNDYAVPSAAIFTIPVHWLLTNPRSK